ncbi:MAG TPA: phosphoribosylamine--glycine ligase [Fusobacterium sp.]|uniref:phosphoribosylamine--glycine ligase n=1 Tax=Fusobacterium sp. TaxID=68766 RepID=UPI002F4113E8
MRILIIGSGGREDAIAWKLQQNPRVEKILIKSSSLSIEELLQIAKEEKIDFTMVGSEELLVKGIVDVFQKENMTIFGPNQQAAMLEGSKAFSKDFMKKYGVKTAKYETFQRVEEALAYVEGEEYPLVVKASGLAAGKGVIICQRVEEAKKAIQEIMVEKVFQEAGSEVVIEEFLEGVEASILSITDSNVILPFISAKDHKKIGEKETGLNTGGMGVIAPNPYVTEEVYEAFQKDILEPTLKGIKAEGMKFAGIIFFGLMITKKGVYLLEYNMRMGDPETQAVLPLLESDFLEMLEDALAGTLDSEKIKWSKDSSCCVVLASGGYPVSYQKGYEIHGLDEVEQHVFFAGVKQENGKYYNNGGRVLNIVATAPTLDEAIQKAYIDIQKVSFQDSYYRKDIGKLYSEIIVF